MSSHAYTAPADQSQRERTLDPQRSVLVQAPAGSGKTDLLTRRFLRLLAEADDPAHVVAITFTKAAAAEMRNRVLAELEKAAERPNADLSSEFSMDTLAARALERSRRLGWNLIDLPAQLRISTIDSFCRELALRRPLLSTLGGSLDVTEQADDLYRSAARNTLLQLDSRKGSAALPDAIATLLDWRDNDWQELENHLIVMLGQRDRWMQEFWLRDFAPDDEALWDVLRERLERPFGRAIAARIADLGSQFESVPGACDEAMELARFACEQMSGELFTELAELAELPYGPFSSQEELEDARRAYMSLAKLLLTETGPFRKSVDKKLGFPPGHKREKQRLLYLIQHLSSVEGLGSALHAVRELPPARYPDEEWRIVRACFTLLRHAAAELQVVFAEAGVVDYIEIAQIALGILKGDGGLPGDAALGIADGIHHLLVDEFQDTSRRQHKLIAALVGAWPDTSDRSVFVVGDPMQSIYFFRDADAELFPRVRTLGLELPEGESLPFDFAQLSSNFRTQPELVESLNETFEAVFSVNDGSNVTFSRAEPSRPRTQSEEPGFQLHLRFVPQTPRSNANNPDSEQLKKAAAAERDAGLEAQVKEIVDLIHGRRNQMESARSRGEKYRIAVLGRTKSALTPIAQALRDAEIPFRAVDLEELKERPEVLDVLALARALMNDEDRVAWLGVLRAPWCGLSLSDLHMLAGADDSGLLQQPIPHLLRERVSLLAAEGRAAVDRLLRAYDDSIALRAAMPGLSIGTWIEQVWLRLGGAACVDAAAHANLALLWRTLDNLPDGEPDLTGAALDAALNSLKAQGDPAAEGDCGIHLMTIHKSKGLEFEVVIVPELQARCGRTRGRMFSWLERGLAQADQPGEITEFLIAPFRPKGGDRGKAEKWVDRQYSSRERQETRRILYVAATRAREELHLFARPEYKTKDGEPELCDPPESLLSTAWPALERTVRAHFETWKTIPQPQVVSTIAAGQNNLIVMPRPPKPAILRRLPIDFATPFAADAPAQSRWKVIEVDPSSLYQRHQGGIISRAVGSAVHLVFEQLARLRASHEWDEARAMISDLHGRLVAAIRSAGIDRDASEQLAKEALDIARRASSDPAAMWILSRHPYAENEVRWTGVVDGSLRTVQTDRVFRAGAEPLSDGQDFWWIVDYKTARTGTAQGPDVLPELRKLFAPQLEAYARILRQLKGPETPIRAGLYYPRMLRFDWWEL